jgi:alkylation response protein AidB-like acyl-CoA dehydrogenase
VSDGWLLGESELDFQRSLRAWLLATTPPPGLRDYGATPTLDDIPAARAWQRQLFEGGWAGMSWPRSFGGRGATPLEQAIFAEELATARLPRQLNIVTFELAGPMIMRFGTPEQQQRFLAPMLRGEEIWCQLFSEPNAGSDLAGLETTARQDGEHWRVRGQKIWTSGAHYAHFGLLLARTAPDAERHAGLTCFLLPMDRPGIDVRPIRQIDGERKFNEVFLDDVRVERSDVLGAIGDGWRVALSTLGQERLLLGAQAVGLAANLEAIPLQALPAATREVVRQRWAELWCRVKLLRVTWLRFIGEGRTGTDPYMSILKLVASELHQEVAALHVDALGINALAGEGSREQRMALLATRGATIAGGTSEIQRNIIAERALGLPRG